MQLLLLLQQKKKKNGVWRILCYALWACVVLMVILQANIFVRYTHTYIIGLYNPGLLT